MSWTEGNEKWRELRDAVDYRMQIVPLDIGTADARPDEYIHSALSFGSFKVREKFVYAGGPGFYFPIDVQRSFTE